MNNSDSDLIKTPAKIMLLLAAFLFIKSTYFPDKLFDLGYTIMRTGQFWALMLAGLAFLGGALWDQMKYRSPHQMGHGISTSFFADDIHKVGEWVVTQLGGIQVTGFNQKGKEGIAVFPGMAYEWMSGNLLAKAVFTKVKPEQLPPKVKQYIENEGLPTSNIKMAIAPSEIEHSNTVYTDWLKNKKAVNVMENKKDDIKEQIMTEVTEVMEWRNGVGLSGKQQGLLQRIEEKLEKKDDDKNR